MADLPRGTVTLLFTDIEGSTTLLRELGRERYVPALETHRRLLREAFVAHGGVEVEMQGDSFHFAFPHARDAVTAAVEGQLALARHDWPDAPVRVRIGLHTGEPVISDGLYAGLDVHRAARIMSVAHGGQVLLSETTAAIVRDELPAELELRDLGAHKLKDLPAPQRLHQLAGEGLGDEFPPLRSLEQVEAPAVGAPASATAQPRERKTVTVLLCDLVDLGALRDEEDPEDVEARVERCHAVVRREVQAFGGAVERFVGDALVAVFGAPVAHEDDPERAVRAGLRIAEVLAEAESALAPRITVETGRALVSPRAGASEGLVAGDVVNTAAGIGSRATVDGVVVGPEAHRLTGRVFLYEELAPVELRGRSEPVAIWRAMAPRARLGTDVTRSHAAAFVGREYELDLLKATFERAARDRSVQLVTLVGEPGVGKSRMAAELFTYVDGQQQLVRWRQGRCLPYGEGITFWALGEIVKAEAGILESDGPDVAATKLDAALPDGEADREWLKARLAPLVGAESGTPVEREEAFSSWRRFLELLASDRPAVLVFEDIHWADEPMLAFLEYLAEWAEGVPLLLVCTARPELYARHTSWAGGTRNATTVNLAPLSDDETGRLVGNLLGTEALPDALGSLVLGRAGGNPLYAEEFVRVLKERRLLVGSGTALQLAEGAELPLPGGIEALITARLDTLAPERKELLHDAAVVGKVFWAGAVAEMAGREEPLVRGDLHELARREFIRGSRASSMAGEAEYAFWHGLVQDVAYAQIPRAERARKHRAAAAWIESRASDRLEDLASLLAHHYLRTVELARAAGADAEATEAEAGALRFLVLAGDRSLGLDVAAAEADYARALELAPPGDPQHVPVLARRAGALRRCGRYGEALELLEGALARGEVALLRLEQGWTLSVSGRVEDAIAALEAGLDAAPGDDPVAGQLLLQLTRAETIQGRLERALVHAQEAQRILELHDDTGARATCARLAGDVYRQLERYDEAAATLQAGIELAERARNVEEVAGCLMNLSLVECERGSLDDAIGYGRRALAEFERIGHGSGRAQGYANLAQLLADTGDDDGALELCERARSAALAIGHTLSLADATDTMAGIALRRGDLGEAAARAEEAAALYSELGAFAPASASLRTAAEAWAGQGAEDEARARLEHASALADASTTV